MRNLPLSDEKQSGAEMPVHILLGMREYSRIRKETPLVIGSGPTYPVVEDTHLGYILSQGATDSETASPGKSFFIASEATGEDQFKKLCSLDVLGLKEPEGKTTGFDHEQYKLNITLQEGHYNTRLPWRLGLDPTDLPTNKAQALQRLNSTTRKL